MHMIAIARRNVRTKNIHSTCEHAHLRLVLLHPALHILQQRSEERCRVHLQLAQAPHDIGHMLRLACAQALGGLVRHLLHERRAPQLQRCSGPREEREGLRRGAGDLGGCEVDEGLHAAAGGGLGGGGGARRGVDILEAGDGPEGGGDGLGGELGAEGLGGGGCSEWIEGEMDVNERSIQRENKNERKNEELACCLGLFEPSR